ncbi:dynactin p62 family-domain-containing protein, partial [Jimgerdemannia flammicorona]
AEESFLHQWQGAIRLAVTVTQLAIPTLLPTIMSMNLSPFVHYHCPCPDIYFESDAAVDAASTTAPQACLRDATQTLDINSPRTDFSLHPLSRLYFCEDCHQIRCPSCVQDEIVSYYCPNCLFEVPQATVKSEKSRCARNCFQCPICQNTLSVVSSSESAVGTQSTTATAVGPYFLSCSVCRWDSQEIGITFERPNSLAPVDWAQYCPQNALFAYHHRPIVQLQKNEEALPDVKEFEHLKEHFDKFLRGPSPPAHSNLLSVSSVSAFSRMGVNPATQQQQRADEIGKYEPEVKVPNDDVAKTQSLISVKHVNEVTTLSQRVNQLHDQPYHTSKIHPQRINLRIKRSKRCRTCRHILIKPEQKAQATRFKIKLVAMIYIPTISIVKLPKKNWPLQLGIPTQFVLKFTNPLYEEISVTLATPHQETEEQRRRGSRTSSSTDGVSSAKQSLEHKEEPKTCGKPPFLWTKQVTLLSPHFTVGPYDEVWGYDEELSSLSGATTPGSASIRSGTSGFSFKREKHNSLAAGWEAGVYEKRNNFTSILVEVVPEKEGEFKVREWFPILVTYTYRPDDDNKMDTAGDAVDAVDDDASSTHSSVYTDEDGNVSHSHKAGAARHSDDEKSEEGLKSYSFWTVVGLGEVVARDATV